MANHITIEISVPKIGQSINVDVPESDVTEWLRVGIGRVLGDAHAPISKSDFSDSAEFIATVRAAMLKRFDNGPLGRERNPRDETADQYSKILRAKLRAAKVDVKTMKTERDLEDAFYTMAEKLGASADAIEAALESNREKARSIVAAMAAARTSGPDLTDLLG